MTATMDTFTQVGKAEDVSGIISNITPTKTPFQSVIGSEGCHNTLFQWQEDSLDAAADNAVLEGADAPASSMTPTVMRSANVQIFTKTAKATGSADKMKTYGRAKELAYQMGKKSAEIKRDFELALVGTHTAGTAGSSSVARRLTPYFLQVAAANKFNFDGSVYASDGTNGALTELAIMNTAQQLYAVGGEASLLMVKPATAATLAGFASATGRTRYLESGAKKIVNVVNVYETPFDDALKVVLNRFLYAEDAILFDPKNWKKMTFRNWFRQTLAVTGDSTNVQILGEFGLRHVNQSSSAVITNLS